MKTKPLMNKSELQSLEIIDHVLHKTPYQVFSSVRMSDVLEVERGEKLSPEDNNFLKTSHFDFVVCGRQRSEPIFSIEFDGPLHQDPIQVKRDIRKNRLCGRAHLDLLRIGYAEIQEHDKVTLLGFMIDRFLAWQQRPHNLNHDDFDVTHPFQALFTISRRLLTDFHIRTPYLSATEFSKFAPKKTPLYCTNLPGSSMYYSGHHVIKETDFTLHKSDPLREWSSPQQFSSSGKDVLYQGRVKFAMQWTLPVVEDYDPHQPGIEYLARMGRLPYTFAYAPGVHIPAIVEWFTEYLSLRAVEDWAQLMLKDEAH